MSSRWFCTRITHSTSSAALAGGLARAGLGAARAGVGMLTRDARHHGLGAWTMARGAGMVSGAFGHRYVEYRR